jgi:hypothetical protein
MVKRKAPATKKRTRSNDRDVEHAKKRMTPEDAWAAIKGGLDEEIVAIVDGIMDGGFTWGDLLRLELYEHARIDKAIRYFLRKPWQSSTLVHSLASVKLQCRKHARVIMREMGPPLRAGDLPVRLAPGMSEAELLADNQDEDEIIN